ncbi:unnamed protein product [Ixodes persulcatus]
MNGPFTFPLKHLRAAGAFKHGSAIVGFFVMNQVPLCCKYFRTCGTFKSPERMFSGMCPSLPDGGTFGDTGEGTEGAAVTGLLLLTLFSFAKLFLRRGWVGVFFVPVLLCMDWLCWRQVIK